MNDVAIEAPRRMKVVLDEKYGFPFLDVETDPIDLELTTIFLKAELDRLTDEEESLIKRSQKAQGNLKLLVEKHIRIGISDPTARKKIENMFGNMCFDTLQFLATYGREYEPADMGPKGFLLDQGNCFGNSFVVARDTDLCYVEGVCRPPFGEPMLHGWNAWPDQTGNEVRDTTYPRADLNRYFGISVPLFHLEVLAKLANARVPGGIFRKERWSPVTKRYLLKHVVGKY